MKNIYLKLVCVVCLSPMMLSAGDTSAEVSGKGYGVSGSLKIDHSTGEVRLDNVLIDCKVNLDNAELTGGGCVKIQGDARLNNSDIMVSIRAKNGSKMKDWDGVKIN